ncbi:MAG: hypothetical protein ACP5NY_03435 [Thermocladium sp.]
MPQFLRGAFLPASLPPYMELRQNPPQAWIPQARGADPASTVKAKSIHIIYAFL